MTDERLVTNPGRRIFTGRTGSTVKKFHLLRNRFDGYGACGTRVSRYNYKGVANHLGHPYCCEACERIFKSDPDYFDIPRDGINYDYY